MKKSLLLAAVAAFVAVATVSAFAEYKVDGKIMGKVKTGGVASWANGDTGFDLNFDSGAIEGVKDFTIGYRMQDSATIDLTNTYIAGAANAGATSGVALTSPGAFKFAMEGRKGAGALNWNVQLIPFFTGSTADYKSGASIGANTNLVSTGGSMITIKPKVTFILTDFLTIATRPWADNDDPLEITMGGVNGDTKTLTATNLYTASKTVMDLGAKASADLTTLGLPVTANAYFAYRTDAMTSDQKTLTQTNKASSSQTKFNFVADGAYKLAITPDLYVKPNAKLQMKGDVMALEQKDDSLSVTNSFKNLPGLTTTIGMYVEVGYLSKITANLGLEIVNGTLSNKGAATNAGATVASNNIAVDSSTMGWNATYLTFGGSATGGEFTVSLTGKVNMSYQLSGNQTAYYTNGSADKGPQAAVSNSSAGLAFDNAPGAGTDGKGTFKLAYVSAEENNWFFKGNFFNLYLMSPDKFRDYSETIADDDTARTVKGITTSVIELGKKVGDFTFTTTRRSIDAGKMLDFSAVAPMDFGVDYASGPVTIALKAKTTQGLRALNVFELWGNNAPANFGQFSGVNASASFTF